MSQPSLREHFCLEEFRARVLHMGRELYREFPWRNTRDPYAIWVSEVMLQQTQVQRVDGRWQRWLKRFPTLDALAAASSADVLEEWQGLGYNRRALSLRTAAQAVADAGGTMPQELDALVALPGIGPATAAGIRAFAYNLPGVYLETNVRTVFLHELYPQAERVPDRELIPRIEASCPSSADDPADDPRTWYYALLDYGAYLKKMVPNPSRRSSTHVRQSRFEGSHRQKRAALVRVLLAQRQGCTLEFLAHELSAQERAAGRPALTPAEVRALLDELSSEGYCYLEDNIWIV